MGPSELPAETVAAGEKMTPGAQLAKARKVMGMTVGDIADQLNVTRTAVEHLEQDNYQHLPPAVFIQGYIRSYARVVDEDWEPLVERFYEIYEKREPRGVPPVYVAYTPSLRERIFDALNHIIVACIVIVLLVVAAIIWYYWPDDESELASEPTIPPTTGVVPSIDEGEIHENFYVIEPVQQAPTPIVEVVETQSSAEPIRPNVEREPPSAETAVPVAASNLANAELATPSAEPTDIEAEIEPPTARVNGAELVAAELTGALRFVFSDECWVEVRDRDGTRLYSDLNSGGEELNIDGRPPLAVRIGNASVVALSYNGESVDLVPHTRNSVANLVLE